jgi:hypothetical protein
MCLMQLMCQIDVCVLGKIKKMAKNHYLATLLSIGLGTGFFVSSDAVAETADATAAPPGVIAAFITAGAIDPKRKVPALDAVKGAGISNISMASPLAVLKHGSFYAFILTSQNVTFKGTCADSYVLQRGAKILARGSIHTYGCAPGTYWEWEAVSPAIPNSPGLATLVGTVTFGGKKTTTSATVLIE